MRFVRSLAALLLVLSSQPCVVAQKASVKTSLDLNGITVWLGMPRTVVEQRLAERNLSLVQSLSSQSRWEVLTDQHVYSLQFTAGRLTFADRSWAVKGKTQLDAVLQALAVLAAQRLSCNIVHDPLDEPDQQTDRVFITCGQRTVLILQGKIGNEPMWDVSERIGDLK